MTTTCFKIINGSMPLGLVGLWILACVKRTVAIDAIPPNAPLAPLSVSPMPVSTAPVFSPVSPALLPAPSTSAPVLSDTPSPTSSPASFAPRSDPPTVIDPTNSPIGDMPMPPTTMPSEEITKSPTRTPSLSPTLRPTTKEPTTQRPITDKPNTRSTSTPSVLKQSSDQFGVRLKYVTSRMSEGNVEFFTVATEKFLAEFFANCTPPVLGVRIQVISQKLLSSSAERRRRIERSLQQLLPLDVVVTIDGTFDPAKANSSVVELGSLSRQYIDDNGTDYIDALQSSDNVTDIAYFQYVDDAESFEASDSIGSRLPTPSPTKNQSSSSLELGGIIAIGVCGGLALLLLAYLVCQCFRKSRSRLPASNEESSPKKAEQTPVVESVKKPLVLKPSRAASVADSGPSMNCDGDSVAYSDIQSNLGLDTVQGMDTMSYAYSLDHGIDGSIISGPESDYNGQFSSASTIPFEIPMLSGSDALPNAPPIVISDDLASLSSKFTRECFAPPGRLGIVIDTTVEGPVIHKVNPGSPLEGIIWPGDVIIAIDDIDTRALSANEITALMAKNMNQRRKLTIMSEA